MECLSAQVSRGWTQTRTWRAPRSYPRAAKCRWWRLPIIGRNRRQKSLVPEVAHTGKNHSHAELVGGSDHVSIANRASRLNNGSRTGFCRFFHAIREREEGVGRNRASGKRKARCTRFDYRNLHGIYAAHLARPDSDCATFAGEDDGVGFHVLADLPTEKQRA